MGRRKRVRLCLLFILICLCLPSACGKNEVYQPELGIDGYVYVAKKLQTGEMLDVNVAIKVVGEYLYYARHNFDEERGMTNGSVIERLNIKEQSLPELVKFIPSGGRMPDYVREEIKEKLSAAADGSQIDFRQVSFFLSFLEFDVDEEGNLYCQEQVAIGKNFEYEPMGATLSKWDSSGEKIYQHYYPDMSGFALCKEGGACILGEKRIIFLNGEGNQTGEISTEQYWGRENQSFRSCCGTRRGVCITL